MAIGFLRGTLQGSVKYNQNSSVLFKRQRAGPLVLRTSSPATSEAPNQVVPAHDGSATLAVVQTIVVVCAVGDEDEVVPSTAGQEHKPPARNWPGASALGCTLDPTGDLPAQAFVPVEIVDRRIHGSPCSSGGRRNKLGA